MSSLSALMFLARDGMLAQSGALDIAGQNVTNANTPGYVRRSAVLEARALTPGAVGGIDFSGIRRHYDKFAEMRIMGETGMLAAAKSRAGGLSGLEGWLTPPEGGVGDSMNALFSAATELATNASDPTARSAFLAKAEQVALSFRAAGNALSQRRSDLAGQAGEVAGELNKNLTAIGDLNKKIAEAQALGQPAADLRDKRDLLVKQVGDAIGATAFEEPNGMVALMAGGTTLVQGDQVNQVAVSMGASNTLKIEVQKPGGAKIDITQRVDSGKLGGIREARDTDLVALQASLDQLAYDFAEKANTVHASGFGLDGVSGRPLFAPPAGVAGAASALVVDPGVAGQPDKVAASGSASSVPAGNDIALAFADIASQTLGAGGTPAERFGSFAGGLGNAQVSAESAIGLREGTLSMAETMREQASGVSIEEEMVDLSRYQRAFEATMRVLKVADELLEGLIREV